jgi:hypothetical protein
MKAHLNCTFRTAVLLCLLAVGCFSALPAAAQEKGLSGAGVEYVFGGPIMFYGLFDANHPPEEALVLFRTRSENHTVVSPMSIEGDRAEFIHDQTSYPLRPFAAVDYWFQLSYADGTVSTSPSYSFVYSDNRFSWQELSRAPFRVYWYNGDVAFAQGILDIAHESLRKAQGMLLLGEPEEIFIYVYASNEDLQASRRLSRRDSVAGHADVDLSVAVVSLPDIPERRMEAERQVPHELMHVFLFQTVRRGYENIPTWLNEGLASAAELYPNPDYQVYLNSAHQQNKLIPLESLCSGFPLEVSDFILSYAESAAFTRYLYRMHGSVSVERLVTHYANGMDCLRGFEVTYGLSLGAMEQQWLAETFGEVQSVDNPPAPLSEAWPWFSLLLLVLVLPIAAVVPVLVKPNKSKGD